MLLALAIWNPQFLCRWGTRCPVFAHWMFCLCRIVSMVGTDGKLMWPLTLWMVQPFWMFPEVLHMSVILDAVFCIANNWNNWAAAGLSCIDWFLSTFTEGMHFALSEWDPWLAPMGDYVPCVCVIWMHWAKSSWCSQVGPIMFCQCRCITLWKVLITVHWVVRPFIWFIEPQQAWAVLVDSYLPLLRECILFHQNGIQHSHKWGTRLPCPILVYCDKSLVKAKMVELTARVRVLMSSG